MEVNYSAVLICGVIAMVLGAIWYGPLFGRKWGEIIGADMSDPAKMEAMKKAAMPLYGIQFLLSLLQVYVLAHFIEGWSEVASHEVAIWLWLGFVVPTAAGASMWTNASNTHKMQGFLIQAGYQLVFMVIAALVLVRMM